MAKAVCRLLAGLLNVKDPVNKSIQEFARVLKYLLDMWHCRQQDATWASCGPHLISPIAFAMLPSYTNVSYERHLALTIRTG